MINPDLTEILEKYSEWDYVVRNKYLSYASTLMKQHGRIIFKEIEYHNVEDLKVDLEAEYLEDDKLDTYPTKNQEGEEVLPEGSHHRKF